MSIRHTHGRRANFHKYQGGWLNFLVQAGIAVGGALLGKRSSDKATAAASTDRERELAIEEKRLELAQLGEDRAAKLFDQYQEMYVPREGELLREAFDREISPAQAEARATTDVRSALETATQMSDRRMGRLGVNPNSGAYQGLDRMRELEGAKIEAGARTRAREDTRGLNFARQSSLVGLGRGLPVTAAGFAGQAASGLGGIAGLAGARSADSASLAYDAGSSYGSALGDLVSLGAEAFGKWWGSRGSTSTSGGGTGGGLGDIGAF